MGNGTKNREHSRNMHMHTHKNTIKSTSIVLYKYTCCRCLVRKKRGGHLESSSRLRYCDLRRVVFQYDHYPGAIVNSSIGYSSWSEREEKRRQGYRRTQYKPPKFYSGSSCMWSASARYWTWLSFAVQV